MGPAPNMKMSSNPGLSDVIPSGYLNGVQTGPSVSFGSACRERPQLFRGGGVVMAYYRDFDMVTG